MVEVTFFTKKNAIEERGNISVSNALTYLLGLFPKRGLFETKNEAYQKIKDLTKKTVYMGRAFHFYCSVSEDSKRVDLQWFNEEDKSFGYLISFIVAEVPTLDVSDFYLNQDNV